MCNPASGVTVMRQETQQCSSKSREEKPKRTQATTKNVANFTYYILLAVKV